MVMIMDGTLRTATPTPLINPIIKPIHTAANTAMIKGSPSLTIVATTAADKPKVAPMDASISPVNITNAIPMAQIV
ncbi:hypothetical protein FHX95_003137 [Clostridium saccharobutylicum]|nr:hypothetical protein [Clostridium saccharobutylicum]NYC30866.1 hypothetical protein [Clostridium saccharobutylicum]